MSESPLYERFDCAPSLRLEAYERVNEIHHANMLHRMDRLDALMERMERRLWLTVYGVVAVILAQAVQGFLAVAP